LLNTDFAIFSFNSFVSGYNGSISDFCSVLTENEQDHNHYANNYPENFHKITLNIQFTW